VDLHLPLVFFLRMNRACTSSPSQVASVIPRRFTSMLSRAVTAAAGLAAVLLMLLAVHWWYGAALARRMFGYARLIPGQLLAVSLLAAATLAFSVRPHTTTWQWGALALAHLFWTILGWCAALAFAWRLQARRAVR